MVINYKVSPTFARFHACKTRYKFVMGPVGSGKSSGCMWDLFFNAAEQTPDENGVRHSRYAVIRATYPQLKSSTVKTFIEWFKDKITVTYGTPITARLNMDLDDGTKVNTEFMFVAVGDEVEQTASGADQRRRLAAGDPGIAGADRCGWQALS